MSHVNGQTPIHVIDANTGPDRLCEMPAADPHAGHRCLFIGSLSRHSIIAKADVVGAGGVKPPGYPIMLLHTPLLFLRELLWYPRVSHWCQLD
jgi:hypothetical protein